MMLNHHVNQRLEDADIARVYTASSVLDKPEYFMVDPLQSTLRTDERCRRSLDDRIIVRRPQIHMVNNGLFQRHEQDIVELRRRNLVYFVRLAPLTERVDQGWMASPAGNFFPAIADAADVGPYVGVYAAKFGFTTRPVSERLRELHVQLLHKGFPEAGLSPYYALCLDGLPDDRLLLQHMESGIRNLFERKGHRLRQHARGIQHPGNRSVFAETFEFVLCDEICITPFDIFARYSRRLNTARRCVRSIVQTLDASRDLHIRRDRSEIIRRFSLSASMENRQASEALEEELEEVDAQTPIVDVHSLYSSVLEYAAATATLI